MTNLLKRRALPLLGLLTSAVFLLLPHVSLAQETVLVQGQVVNGTLGAEAPVGLEVTFHLGLESGGEETRTAVTDSQGHFQFEAVPRDESLLYALTTEYQGAAYRVFLPSPPEPGLVELQVFESTSQADLLRQDSGLVIVVDVDAAQRTVAIFEVVQVSNPGDRTVVPDLTQASQMDILRFALPPGAKELDVQAELTGGSIVQVEAGFGLTTPVPPGEHSLVYTYLVPYEGETLDLTRSFPFGVESFHILVPQDMAELEAPSFEPFTPVTVSDVTYQQLSAADLPPGASLTVRLRGLPQPSLLQRWKEALTDGLYLKVGVPVVVALALAALVVYAIVLRRARWGKTPGEAPAQGADTPVDQRRALVQAIAELDDRLQRQEIGEDEHQKMRRELVARLHQLGLRRFDQ